jgi:tRNA threonylcarbamoyladenosine modification (KEOPS) complex Cgi121 subunit
VLVYIREFRKRCEIAGFRGVEVSSAEGFLKALSGERPVGVEVQFFDADLVATWQHLYFALLNALTAFKNGENISKSVAMETLLYASARGQIQRATQVLGIKPSSSNVAVLIVGGKREAVQSALAKVSRGIGGRLDDSVLGLSKEKVERIRRAFDVSEVELETVVEGDSVEKALVDLVVERVALLATAR